MNNETARENAAACRALQASVSAALTEYTRRTGMVVEVVDIQPHAAKDRDGDVVDVHYVVYRVGLCGG